MEWFIASASLAAGFALGVGLLVAMDWHPTRFCAAFAPQQCECCGRAATVNMGTRLATCAFCSERCRAPGANSPDPNWYHGAIPPSPFPLIGDVRMSHDEYHGENPTAKCGMSCHWYAEEKRQGLA